MSVQQVVVGKRKYNVAPAPANEQKKLLSLLGAKLAVSSARANITEIDADVLFGVLLTLSEDEFDLISSIVLYKTVENNKDNLITIDDFQDNVFDYYRLTAHAIEVNLGSFLSYLADAHKGEAKKAKKA